MAGRMVHLGLSSVTHRATAEHFFSLRPCCLDPDFGEKAYGSLQSAERMIANIDFMSALRTWALSYCFTDMWSERCLARIRQATDGHGAEGSADVERVCSSGFLAQLLTQHKLNGGDDPRAPTRRQLLEDGVPLICRKPQKIPKQRGVFVNFMQKAQQARKDQGTVLSGDSYRAWRQAKVIEFYSLSPQQMSLEAAEARAAHSRKLEELEATHDEPSGDVGYGMSACTGTILDVIGDRRCPYTTDAFAHRIKSSLELPEVLFGNGVEHIAWVRGRLPDHVLLFFNVRFCFQWGVRGGLQIPI
jgi:hypothetical protein